MSFCEKKCQIVGSIIVFFVVFIIANVIFMNVSNESNLAHINSFNYTPENVQNGAYITFDTNRVVEKEDISHQEGRADFIINQAGNYYIQFNTTIYEPPSTGKETTLSVYLEHNNATVYGTTVGETVSNAYQTVNLSFGVIIKANSGDIVRVKNNSGTVVELLQPNISIIRIK